MQLTHGAIQGAPHSRAAVDHDKATSSRFELRCNRWARLFPRELSVSNMHAADIGQAFWSVATK
jgi:hypothetical protein